MTTPTVGPDYPLPSPEPPKRSKKKKSIVLLSLEGFAQSNKKAETGCRLLSLVQRK